MIISILIAFVTAYVLWSLICLELNVRRALKLDIPLIRVPIDGNNVPWMIFESNVWFIIDNLPVAWSSLPASIRHLRRGWHFREKYGDHARLGPVFALVTPVTILIHVADLDAIGDIFSRRKDFIRPIENYKILEIFGPCLSTADTNNWPRHRKALAAPFNENIMSFVWNETLIQAKAMVASWLSTTGISTGVPSVQSDTRSVSLNVLAATGFRKSYDFQGSVDGGPVEEGSYRTALQTVLDNAILLMLLPYKALTFSLMPKSFAKIGKAGEDFKKFILQMLEEETRALKTGGKSSGGIMASLLIALNAQEKEFKRREGTDAEIVGSPKGLTMDEIFGNIFIINFAGHDTTANTLAFTMYLLVSEPHIQEWLAEEIHAVTRDHPLKDGSYEALFSNMVRCKAVLYETLRLYPPIIALPKSTDSIPTHLRVPSLNRTLTIPPHTYVTLSLLAVQTSPANFPNPLAWDPTRWIESPDSKALSGSAGTRESFLPAKKNTYFPWSDGPQNCLGKKFSEVEFVAAIAAIMERGRVEVVREEGESEDAAKARVRACVQDVSAELLVRMRRADSVRLKFREIGG